MNTSAETLTISATAVVRHYLGINTKQALSLDELVSDGGFPDSASALRALSSGLSDLRSSRALKFGVESNVITTRSLSESWMELKKAINDLEIRSKTGKVLGPPGRARAVLTLRYGLDGDTPETLEVIGQHFDLTRERVRQIEKRALLSLPKNIQELIKNSNLSHKHSRMQNAAKRKLETLSSNAGEEIHRTQDLVDSVVDDPNAWPFALEIPSSLIDADPMMVVKKILGKSNIVWLDDDQQTFLKLGGKTPYENITCKLLNVHESISVEVIHDAISQIWSVRTDRSPFTLDVEELTEVILACGFNISDGYVSAGSVDITENALSVPNDIEMEIATILKEAGGFETLENLRNVMPELQRNNTTASQYLMGKSPLIERLGPSIYGLRGARLDTEKLSRAQQVARNSGHPWVNRAGFENLDQENTIGYRLSDRHDPKDDIGVSESLAYWFSDDWDGNTEEIYFMVNSKIHSTYLKRSSGSIRLYGLSGIWEALNVTQGTVVEFTKVENVIKAANQFVSTDSQGHSTIHLGRGWVRMPR